MWDAHKTALRLLVRGRTGETGWMGDGIIYSVFCSRSRSVVRLVGVGLDATVEGRGGRCGAPHSPNTTGTSSNRRNLDIRQESQRVLPRPVLTFHSPSNRQIPSPGPTGNFYQKMYFDKGTY